MLQWRLCSLAVVLVSCFLAQEAVAQRPRYMDPRQPVEVRVNDLLSRMTLDEKIGQMTQIERGVASPSVIEKYKIGSCIPFLLSHLLPVGFFVTILVLQIHRCSWEFKLD